MSHGSSAITLSSPLMLPQFSLTSIFRGITNRLEETMNLTSILKKVAMAITGLGLFVFVVMHLAGNLLIFVSPEAFNGYSAKLHDLGPLLWVTEAGLLLFFVVHAASGIRVAIENRRARQRGYEVKKTAGEATLASRSMVPGGIILAIFLVLHIRMFKFGDIEGAGGLW